MDVESGEVLPLDDPIDPLPYLTQIQELRVVSKCGCGDPNCHTIRFQNFGPGPRTSVAIVTYHTEDDRMLIIFEDEETGMLSELEII